MVLTEAFNIESVLCLRLMVMMGSLVPDVDGISCLEARALVSRFSN